MGTEEQVLVERLVAGMRTVIDELSPEDRQRAIAAIRAVDRDIAQRLETPPNKTHWAQCFMTKGKARPQ